MKKGILLMLLFIMHIEISISAQERSLDLSQNSIGIFESAFININKTFFPQHSINIVSAYDIALTIPNHKKEKSAPVIVKNKNNYEGLELWTGLGLYIFMNDDRQVDSILEAGSRVTENNRKYEKSGYFEF
ncbi:hypothetical protein FACS1894142_8850 [Spirochaetia bacterium]|nr:hypothetical protein FACS1894142_8850 [Spirochaetia bacterium]